MALALGMWVSKNIQLPRDMVKFSGKRNCECYNKIINCHAYIKALFRGRQRDGGKKACLGGGHEYPRTMYMESKGQYQMSSPVTLPYILRQTLSLN